MRKIIIALDGYSSCGKSTLARQLAGSLHYQYIDSGSMYRAITLYFLQESVNWKDHVQVRKALLNLRLEFRENPGSRQPDLYLNGENVEQAIRDMIVSEKVSEVAAIREIREFAVSQQRHLGLARGIVMDGRDIGTVVFPDAELKLFMTADISVRVQRRYKEIFARNPNTSLEEVRDNLVLRDFLDSNREISPLKRASDAIELDNSNMSQSEQLDFALEKFHEVQEALKGS